MTVGLLEMFSIGAHRHFADDEYRKQNRSSAGNKGMVGKRSASQSHLSARTATVRRAITMLLLLCCLPK